MRVREALPCGLSLLRVLIIPFVIYFGGTGRNLNVTFWLCLFAALSDYFDGVLARYLNSQSNTGKVIDFLADKLFLPVALLSVSHSIGGDPAVIGALVAYHLLILIVSTVVSWSVGKPLVAITTGEKLVVIFSYILILSLAGRGAFPDKGIYSSMVWISGFLAISSLIFGVASYIRLARRLLTGYRQ